MIDESSQPTTDQLGSAPDECSFEDQRHELELELIKVRAEAEAARLEARAAELELTIRRMSRSRQFEPDQISRAEPAQTTVPAAPHGGTPDLSPSLRRSVRCESACDHGLAGPRRGSFFQLGCCPLGRHRAVFACRFPLVRRP